MGNHHVIVSCRINKLGIAFENRRISRVIALKKAQNWPNSPVFAPFCAGFQKSK
jgi:hypothetical protein